jgi:hypothetical protein
MDRKSLIFGEIAYLIPFYKPAPQDLEALEPQTQWAIAAHKKHTPGLKVEKSGR